ncbi:MAG: LamG domain-containing protein [Verrucomicrobiaceae bacterium]|nr:MAG: LamG domain-containing protein [Verrucomicrobiaceae bacterium]
MKKFFFIPFTLAAGLLTAQGALTDQLVGYYDFEETGSAGIANKVSGATAHSGTYIGTPANGAGSGFAGDAAFAGTNANVATDPTDNTTNRPAFVGRTLNLVKGTATPADGGQFTVTTLTSRGTGLGPVGAEFGTLGTQFAISAWYYLAPDPDNGSLSTDAQRRFVFESVLDGASTTQVYDISWGTSGANATYAPYVGQVLGSMTGVAADGWHHVVHSFSTEGANTRLTVHVDGVQVSTLTAPTANVDFRGINFGTNRFGNARVFDGMIDEVGVWNRSLSPAEVTELFQRGTNRISIVQPVLLVSLAADPSAGGTVSGSGVHASGSVVPIAATPNRGYVFSAWSGDFAGRPASFDLTVSSAVNAVALFGPDNTDSDGDGLSNFLEVTVHLTDPDLADTDGDLIPDGVEVNVTATSPTVSDETLVSFIRNNLGAGNAGIIEMSPLRIDRNAGTGEITLSLGLWGSADGASFEQIQLGAPGAGITPADGGWNLTFPAPSNSVNSYILKAAR